MSWDWEKLKQQQQNRGDIPPKFDDIIKKFNQFKFPGGGPIVIVLIIIGIAASTMLFTVGVDEVGVVQRFGKYVRTEEPGLNVKLPFGIEKVTKVKERRIYNEEFGFRSVRSGGGGQLISGNEGSVSLMLTGDLQVALVPWIVQYRIKDSYNFLFKVHDINRLLRDLSEAAMRLVVGDRSITEVITKREEIAVEAKEVLQKELDMAETGIHIVTIELKRTNVPEPVQPSFNEVNQSVQEKERMIYQANEEYNKAIPAAKGEKERVIKAAEGYKLDRINRAQGDVSRFKSVYEEFAKAPDVTQRRLYIEAMKDIFPKLGQKYIVDEDLKGILPLLNLDKQSGNIK